MASEKKYDSNGIPYVLVEADDTLSQIALDYLGSAQKYKVLASINKITNPDFIYIDQQIYLAKVPTQTLDTAKTANYVTFNAFGLQSNSDNTLFATWTWNKESSTKEYKVIWYYATGDGVSFVANDGTNSVDEDMRSASRQSTHSIPSNATKMWVKVLPVWNDDKDADHGVDEWTATWATSDTYLTSSLPPATPSTPDVTIKDLSLTVALDNIDTEDNNATDIQFQVRVDYGESDSKTKTVEIVANRASYQFTSIQPGHVYNVRCRAYDSDTSLYSDWTGWTSDIYSKPAAPGGITTIRAEDKTTVYLEWESSATATSYEIEYTTEEKYFDASSNVTTITTHDTTNYYYVDGLATGEEYYFRVRAILDKSSEESDWTDIKSVVVGSTPSAPTTWSSTTTAIIGEKLYLYWVHNSKDGSYQTAARLKMVNSDGNSETVYDFGSTAYTSSDGLISYTPLTKDEQEEGIINSCTINTSKLSAGVELSWSISTAGVTGDYSEYSTVRTVTIYEQPSVSLSVQTLSDDGVTYKMLDTDYDENFVVTGFPFYIYATASPNNEVQKPIGYHISITSNSYYETVDTMGKERVVNAGEVMYSNYFDGNAAEFRQAFTPANLDLENSYTYTVKCTVSMSSGLTAEDSCIIAVDWVATHYSPNAVITIDDETLTATIRPYCENTTIVYYEVEYNNGRYTRGTTGYDYIYGERVSGAVTTTGDRVYSGISPDDEEIYYCIVEEVEEVAGATMDVYRREFDGTFTKINDTALDVEANTAVSDPHPALDYARYRIVATDNSTGAISYYDMPGKKVGCTSVIMQWDDTWTSFDVEEDAETEQPAWSGSMLRLPYNITVSDSNNRDISLVEYAGRENPVSYYGTHRGYQSTWTTDIDKTDKETLYALRRLQRWMGDVYVREPSGSGYWASVSVSFKVSYDNSALTIPVTFNINRVEGGM